MRHPYIENDPGVTDSQLCQQSAAALNRSMWLAQLAMLVDPDLRTVVARATELCSREPPKPWEVCALAADEDLVQRLLVLLDDDSHSDFYDFDTLMFQLIENDASRGGGDPRSD